MLTYLPIALACLGLQPCPPGLDLRPEIPRLSAVAPVPVPAPLPTRSAPAPSLRRASERLVIAPASVRSREPRAQVPLITGGGRRSTKGMLICAGIVAGIYAGAAIGSAIDDDPDEMLGLLGAPIGGAVGGLLVWKVVK